MRRTKKILAISAIVVVVTILAAWLTLILIFTSQMPHEMSTKRNLESKNLLPFMIAGAQRNAAGITPAFSESDMKRFYGTGISRIDSISSAGHVAGLDFHISAGPDAVCSIMIFTNGQGPLPGLYYYDDWGNGVWWHQNWPFWMP